MAYKDALDALSDPTRRALFERLRGGPCSVGELVEAVPVSQPAVSQHLRVLREARLVHVRKEGNRRIYRLNPEGLTELRRYVEGLWGDVLESFRETAVQESKERRKITMPNQSVNVEIMPVKKKVQVPLPAEDAFQLFTQSLDTWWPLKTHSMGEEAAETAVFEGRTGGKIYEIQKDGTRVEWGTVTAWEPPKRVVFSWHPGRGSETAQEVEVLFSEQGDDTHVKLIHRGWERLGEKGKTTRENYNQGWDTVLGSYVSQASGVSTAGSPT